jgi:hypothetical protein
MTDAQHPVGPPEASESEELAAAILDGEATPAELARADEPAVAAALAAQRRAAATLAVDVPVDEAARERSIAAALAVRDEGTAAAAPRRADDLADRRARRAAGTLPVLAAAAAVVVALVVGALALAGRSDDDEDLAATAEDSAPTGAADAAGGASGSGVDEAATALALGLDLGAFDDVEHLVAAAARRADLARSSAATAEGSDADHAGSAEDAGALDPTEAPASTVAGPACAPPLPEGTVVSTATAILDGRPVLVTVLDGDDGTVVQVVDAATCDVVYEGPAD